MAGYMTKVVGSDGIYDGSYKAGEALTNGIFVSVQTGKLKKLTAAGDIIMLVREKTTLWGKKAIVLDVQDQGAGTIYFVEQVNPGVKEQYDDTNPVIALDEFVRAHIPLAGEQMIITVDDTLYAALSEGDLAKPASGGLVAKYTA